MMDPTACMPNILKAGSSEEKGETARLQTYIGAIAIGELVKSTLGPKGMDKILQPMGGDGQGVNKMTVTNDGATILKSVWIDNPAAKILVDMSKTQDSQCGDGTTSVVVLAAEFLRQAEHMVTAKIHPQVIKKAGGSLKDSYLADGFILEKRIGVGQAKRQEKCKVMVANTPMDTDKVKIYGARVKVDSFEAVAAVEQAEKDKMKAKVNKILAHGCNVFINRQLIYNHPDQLLKEGGCVAIGHSDFDGTERLAAVLGADILSTFDEPDEKKLGYCESIEEIMIGEDKVVQFSGCKQNEACTVVLRGASEHVLDEAERSLHDALAVLFQTITETRVVYGGGATEMEMSKAVMECAQKTDGKLSTAVEGYARALQQIPTILADNGGFDSAELVGQLRAKHAT